jgi:hypothetical protein
MSQVNVELGFSATAQISLNDSAVRTLAGVPSGTISMQNLQGKSNQFSFTIASNITNANLRTLAINAGWNQASRLICTINSGIYVSSNSTGTPALTVNGSFPNGVELTNNGFIIGMGGAGANASANSSPPGSAGGLAFSVASAISVRNNGTIGGGGGGGGAGGSASYQAGEPPYTSTVFVSGGGGGGGRSSAAANSAGGTTQGAGSSGTTNGGPGTVSAPGAGGIGAFDNNQRGATGGGGGQWGAAGAAGGSAATSGGAGGGGGAAISGNGNITWLAFGTRLGAIT